MCQDSRTLKSPYIARGLCIVTGESFPNVAQSRLARAIIVDIKQNSINLNKLSELQDNKDKLAFCMMQYIKWIIDNEEKIRAFAREKMKKLQHETQNNDIHGRTNESVNIMTIGFTLFLNFMRENEIISYEKERELKDLCYTTLLDVANNQAQEVEESSPINLFFNALEQLYMTKKIYLTDFYDCSGTEKENSILVGYIDNKGDDGDGLILLFPDIIYKEIVKLYREQNIKFPISKSALWKYLDVEGYLYKTSKMQRRTIRRKKPHTENSIAFIPILQRKMNNIFLAPTYQNMLKK